MQIELIIIAYFLFIIGIGVYSAFQVKKPEDYYVAGKRAGLIPVSGSLLATILGGSAVLGTIELSQAVGWPALWFLFSAALGLLVLVPVSKYVRRYGNFTLPELLGKFYGKKVETIASVIIPLAWVGIIAAQIIAAAKILTGLHSLSYQQAAIISGAIFILYTLLGGQWSILKTDTLQSVLILVGLAAMLFFIFSDPQKQVSAPARRNMRGRSRFDLLILLITYSVTFVVGPDIYSRIFCARNEKTAANSVLIVALILIPVSFGLTYLGVFSQNSGEGIVSFAQHLLPSWGYGLFLAALLSAVMSSADTTLLTSAIILSELITGNLEREKSLVLTRFLIVAIGILSIIIALYVTSIIQALLLALTFFSGAFVVPTLAGLLKLRVNKKYIITAIISGGLIALSGKIVSVSFHKLTGNLLIIVSYVINSLLLFYPLKQHGKVNK